MKSNHNKNILVMMSAYNGEKYIEDQIKSILEQTIGIQVHLRIRDDGSNDDTIRVIQRAADKYGDRIEVIKGENIGYNASFFALINGADGYDYYALSDQDDIWLPSKLEAAIKALECEDVNMPLLYASTSFLVDDSLVPYGQTRRKQRPFTIYNTAIQNICPGHTQVFNNALLKIIQDEDVDGDRVYVYDSWITSHAVLYGKVIFNNSSFTYYRQHKGNELGSGVGKFGQLMASIRRDASGDGHKYRKQVEYLVEKNERELKKKGYYDELKAFIDARQIIDKVRYIVKSRLYRQSSVETFIFYLAVLIGKY